MKDQIQFETNGLTVLALRVPSMSFGYDIQNYTTEVEFIYMLNLEEIDPELANDETLITVKIPIGNWKYHCTTSDMTEEQAKVLVERCDDGLFIQGDAYTNYEDDDTFFNSALESIPGLLRSHGIDPNEKRVLLIKEK